MMATTHIMFGIFLMFATGVSGGSISAPVVAAVALGSLLPDIDHPRSMVGRPTRPVSTLVHALVGHRTLTHSFVGLVGFSLLAYATTFDLGVDPATVLAFLLGYSGHILADMLNRTGVEILYPKKRRYSLLGDSGIRTDGIGEHLFSAILLVGVVSLSIFQEVI